MQVVSERQGEKCRALALTISFCALGLAASPSSHHFNICYPEHSSQTLRILGFYTPAPTQQCSFPMNLSSLPRWGKVGTAVIQGSALPTITLVALLVSTRPGFNTTCTLFSNWRSIIWMMTLKSLKALVWDHSEDESNMTQFCVQIISCNHFYCCFLLDGFWMQRNGPLGSFRNNLYIYVDVLQNNYVNIVFFPPLFLYFCCVFFYYLFIFSLFCTSSSLASSLHQLSSGNRTCAHLWLGS